MEIDDTVSIDTNVLVRFLVKDDALQNHAAKGVFEVNKVFKTFDKAFLKKALESGLSASLPEAGLMLAHSFLGGRITNDAG